MINPWLKGHLQNTYSIFKYCKKKILLVIQISSSNTFFMSYLNKLVKVRNSCVMGGYINININCYDQKLFPSDRKYILFFHSLFLWKYVSSYRNKWMFKMHQNLHWIISKHYCYNLFNTFMNYLIKIYPSTF